MAKVFLSRHHQDIVRARTVGETYTAIGARLGVDDDAVRYYCRVNRIAGAPAIDRTVTPEDREAEWTKLLRGRRFDGRVAP